MNAQLAYAKQAVELSRAVGKLRCWHAGTMAPRSSPCWALAPTWRCGTPRWSAAPRSWWVQEEAVARACVVHGVAIAFEVSITLGCRTISVPGATWITASSLLGAILPQGVFIGMWLLDRRMTRRTLLAWGGILQTVFLVTVAIIFATSVPNEKAAQVSKVRGLSCNSARIVVPTGRAGGSLPAGSR